MSRYGKMNLWAMLVLPVVALLGSMIVFGAKPDTMMFVFGTNAVPMVIGGLISAVLLRLSSAPAGGRWLVALWPTLVPAGLGILWYLFGLVSSGGDAGREYFAGPFYLLLWLGAATIAAILGCIFFRSSAKTA